MVRRVGKKVWNGEEEVKLSKLLMTFWQRHGCLPHVRSYGFWKAVKDRLQRFSVKQIQRKVPSLRKRHLQLFSGNAREVKPHEAETLSIWVKMIGRSDDDEQDEEDDAAPASAGDNAMYERKESAHCKGTDSMQADVDEGKASGHQRLQNEGQLGREQAGYGMCDAGVGGDGEARGGTDSSCSIVEEPDEPEDPEEVEEVEEDEEVEEMEERQEEEQGWDAAAECDSTQENSHQAFRQKAASPRNPRQEFKMLSCMTVADLASAVRTLAEIVARPVPV